MDVTRLFTAKECTQRSPLPLPVDLHEAVRLCLADHVTARCRVALPVLAMTCLALLRLMLHDQSGAALMRLAAEGIALHDAPLAPPPYERSAEGACNPAALTGTLSTFKGRGAPLRGQCIGPFPWQLSTT